MLTGLGQPLTPVVMKDVSDKIDLNAPAFGPGSQSGDVLNKVEPSVEEQPEVKQEEEESVETSVEENKVPYSRFKKYHDEARQAKIEAEEWRRKAEELEQQRPTRYEEDDSSMPSYWKELYGDSDASRRAWQIQEQREQEIEKRAYEAALRATEEQELIQQERIEGNVAAIDENFELLSDYVGRELTAKEQSAILDIVDDFTPKDEYGRYAGPLIPFDKAWEMYELKQGSARASQRKDRDNVAALSGTSSQGNTEVNEEADRNWNPLARGTWRKRL